MWSLASFNNQQYWYWYWLRVSQCCWFTVVDHRGPIKDSVKPVSVQVCRCVLPQCWQTGVQSDSIWQSSSTCWGGNPPHCQGKKEKARRTILWSALRGFRSISTAPEWSIITSFTLFLFLLVFVCRQLRQAQIRLKDEITIFQISLNSSH